MATWSAGTTSATGARLKLTPALRSSRPQRCQLPANSASENWPCSMAGGIRSKPGPCSRCTRPPSWSTATNSGTPPGAAACSCWVYWAMAESPSVRLPNRMTAPAPVAPRSATAASTGVPALIAIMYSWPAPWFRSRRSAWARQAANPSSGALGVCGCMLAVVGASEAGLADGRVVVAGAADVVVAGVGASGCVAHPARPSTATSSPATAARHLIGSSPARRQP